MTWKIPLADIDFDTQEEEAVLGVLRSKWLTMGAVTQEFEKAFAAYCGVKHAIACTNATAALHMACLAAGLGPGDEAIVPSLTFVATANAIRYTGATPVFADICNLKDLNISPDSIESLLTPKTRAVLVVHYAGYACDMVRISALARRYGLAVIEDAAHAPGAWLEGCHLGTWGLVGCFSFFSNKNMTTGEGGMMVTNDDSVAERLRLLRSHGMTTLTWDRHKGHSFSYDVVETGYNYRIDEIRAALGLVQLGKLESNNARRRELSALYRKELHGACPSVQIPFSSHPGISSAHIMPVLLPGNCNRARFMEAMKNQGVQTSIHYPPIHRFSAYRRVNDPAAFSLPVTEEAAAHEVTLPLYAGMRNEDVTFVVQAVRQAVLEVNRIPA